MQDEVSRYRHHLQVLHNMIISVFYKSVSCLRFANLFCNHDSFEYYYYPSSRVHSKNVCIFESMLQRAKFFPFMLNKVSFSTTQPIEDFPTVGFSKKTNYLSYSLNGHIILRFGNPNSHHHRSTTVTTTILCGSALVPTAKVLFSTQVSTNS